MLLGSPLMAQTTTTPGFSDLPSLTAQELGSKLEQKVFLVQLKSGDTWRLDFRSNGFFYVNTGTGYSASGKWRTEDGKLCTEGKYLATVCNDARLDGDTMLFLLDSGEVVRYLPK